MKRELPYKTSRKRCNNINRYNDAWVTA